MSVATARSRGLFRVGEMSTGRIEAFSDGVFAIVITLLVLEIHVPQVSTPAISAVLTKALIAMWPKFLAYMLSFAIVCIWWVAHHHLFACIARSDRGLLWFNSLYLLWLAFIPFPTALMGRLSQPAGRCYVLRHRDGPGWRELFLDAVLRVFRRTTQPRGDRSAIDKAGNDEECAKSAPAHCRSPVGFGEHQDCDRVLRGHSHFVLFSQQIGEACGDFTRRRLGNTFGR